MVFSSILSSPCASWEALCSYISWHWPTSEDYWDLGSQKDWIIVTQRGETFLKFPFSDRWNSVLQHQLSANNDGSLSVVWFDKEQKMIFILMLFFNRSHSILFLSIRISFVHYRWLQITKAKREIPYSKISMMILKNQKGDFKDNTKKVQCPGGCHANIPDIRDIL